VEAASPYRLLGDEPSAEGSEPLGFDGVAGQLASAIWESRVSSPFTVGIEGGWGAGKSSLMRRIGRALPVDAETVWFNAWAAEGASALEGLIKTVLLELDASVLRRAMRNKKLWRWAGVPVRLVAGRLGLGAMVDEVWRRFEVDAQARNELTSLLKEAIENWRDKARGVPGGRLLVVFVDDLDRASPERVFEVFEAVKLYLNAPGLVFVLGYDNTVVSQAILEEKKYGNTVTGRDYLEKVIQISYRIPRPEQEQALALLRQYAGACGMQGLLDDAAETLVVERNRWNPRRIKRFLNSFVLEYGLDPDWAAMGPQSLIHALLLYIYFPDFASLFEEGGDTDTLAQFLDYAAQRTRLRGEGDAEGLARAEQDLPPMFPKLAQDLGFLALVKSIAESASREQLVDKLQRTPLVFATSKGDDPSQSPGALELPTVLWLGPMGPKETPRARYVPVPVPEDPARWVVGVRPDVVVIDGDIPLPLALEPMFSAVRAAASTPTPIVVFTPRSPEDLRQQVNELGGYTARTIDEVEAFLPARPAPGAYGAPS
jgi:hypothetical protein